jgi:hypothetical protein
MKQFLDEFLTRNNDRHKLPAFHCCQQAGKATADSSEFVIFKLLSSFFRASRPLRLGLSDEEI